MISKDTKNSKAWKRVKIIPTQRDDKKEYDKIRIIKRIMGITLIIVAVMFGGFLSKMNVNVAYATVFAYISAQAGLWL